MVRLDDGSEKVLSVHRIAGTLIPDHPDIEREVVVLGDRDKGEKRLLGKIVAVYDNGVRKIEILGSVKIRFVDKTTKLEDGGYWTLEQLAANTRKIP